MSPIVTALLLLWLLATLFLGGVAAPFERVYPFLCALIGIAAWRHFRTEHRDEWREPIRKSEVWGFLAAGFLGTVVLLQLIPWSSGGLKAFSPLAWNLTFGVLSAVELPSSGLRFPASLDAPATWRGLAELLSMVILIVVSTWIMKDLRTRRRIAHLLVMGGAGFALFGLLHRFSGSPKMFWLFERGSTFFGPYVSRNHAGALFAVTGAIGFGLMGKKRDRTDRLWISLFFGLIFLGLLFTGSRAALFAFAVSLLAGIFLWKGNQHPLVRSKYAAAVGILVLGTALLWKATLFLRFFPSKGEISVPEFRLAFWKYAVDFWKQSPLLGIGLGAFSKFSPTAVGDTMWLHPEHVENDYLELLANCGAVGCLGALVILAFLFRAIYRTLIDSQGSSTKKAFALGLIALCLNSLFVFNAPLPAHQVLAAILVGGVLASHEFHHFSSRFARRSFAVAIALVFFTGVFSHVKEQRSAQIGAKDVGASPANSRAQLLLEREEIETAVRKDPLDAGAMYKLALMLARSRERDRAEAAAQAAQRLDPFRLGDRVAFAQEIARSDPELGLLRAEELLEKASQLPSGLQIRILLLAAELRLDRSEIEKAHSYMARASAIDPRDWRLLLFQSISSSAGNRIIDSWQSAEAKGISGEIWDAAFARTLAWRKSTDDISNTLAWLGRKRHDAGEMVRRIGPALRAKKLPSEVRLDLGAPSPRYLANNATTSANARWLTPPASTTIPEEIQIHVLSVQTDLDAYLLPVSLKATPANLGLRLILTTRSAPNASPRMVLRFGNRYVVSEEPPGRTQDGRLKYEMRGPDRHIPAGAEPIITGIGFTPMEKDGIYAVGPLEIFVDSER